MPTSDPEGREWAVERIAKTTAPIIIDLGPGQGTYSDLAKGWRPDAWWVGVEIWPPYVDRYQLWRKYDCVAIQDARNIDFPRSPYVLLAGDVLEHMYRSDALDILHRAKEHAEAIMVSVPVVPYPQHEHEGNPFEHHLDQWTFAQMWDVLDDGVVHGLRGNTIGRFWWTPRENGDPDPIPAQSDEGSAVDVCADVDHG